MLIGLAGLVDPMHFGSIPRLLTLFPIGIGGMNLYSWLGIPHTITWPDNSSPIEFKSMIRTFTVIPGEILSIMPSAKWPPGYLEIRSRKRRFTIRNQFDGMHEFLTRLEAVNPRVELKGC